LPTPLYFISGKTGYALAAGAYMLTYLISHIHTTSTIPLTLLNSGSPVIIGIFMSLASSMQKASAYDSGYLALIFDALSALLSLTETIFMGIIPCLISSPEADGYRFPNVLLDNDTLYDNTLFFF